ncbi:putative chromatin regulator PHD family [Arabidopsis thaliana]
MSSTESKVETITQLMSFHHHPLLFTNASSIHCILCNIRVESEDSLVCQCIECGFSLHIECVEIFELFHQPLPCSHFPKIFINGNHDCHFCKIDLSTTSLYARCTICNVNMDLDCMVNLPPLTIFEPKHHKHSFNLLLRVVTFTCNACGLEGDRNPYVCYECHLMVHKDCIEGLPRVIYINRHDHRVSHTFHPGQEERDWECGVCRRTIDWVYGAYTCSLCPSYAVHSKCATRKEVWDGRELEDVSEEDEEIEDPFKVINETDIIHFSHEEHVLRLDENCHMENDATRCRGCILAINGNLCYKCLECDFIIHKACASLPRKRRHFLHNHKLTLRVDKASIFLCSTCDTTPNGFRYECDEDHGDEEFVFDLQCSSISEPFLHDLHPHPLYWTLEYSKKCKACGTKAGYDLNCIVCDDYSLCMTCATLPRKVKHRCDDHLLSLRQGASDFDTGHLWCDICETKTDPSVFYYTCDDCGVSLHLKCVLGDLYNAKLGLIDPRDPAHEVLPNNGVTRPFCFHCELRCKFPFLIRRATEEFTLYYCSLNCCLEAAFYIPPVTDEG